jgi:hypothetical protein
LEAWASFASSFFPLETDLDQPVVRVPGTGRDFGDDGKGMIPFREGIIVRETVDHLLDPDSILGRKPTLVDITTEMSFLLARPIIKDVAEEHIDRGKQTGLWPCRFVRIMLL